MIWVLNCFHRSCPRSPDQSVYSPKLVRRSKLMNLIWLEAQDLGSIIQILPMFQYKSMLPLLFLPLPMLRPCWLLLLFPLLKLMLWPRPVMGAKYPNEIMDTPIVQCEQESIVVKVRIGLDWAESWSETRTIDLSDYLDLIRHHWSDHYPNSMSLDQARDMIGIRGLIPELDQNSWNDPMYHTFVKT